MTTIFGEVAAMYDDVRPGYPAAVGEAIATFHGGPPATVVEIGAGTGKGTTLLARLGGTLTCLEPDARMAAVLRANFPQATVATTTFEEWAPPPGGADLLASALSWHWLDERTRNRRAHDTLRPGGTLAIFGHMYGYRDRTVGDTVANVVQSINPRITTRDKNWVHRDVLASGLFADVEQQVWHTYPTLTREKFLQLVQTFGPYRQLTPEEQRAGLAGLADALDDAVTLDLRTSLILARRPAA